jgi:hypothetical protein
LLDGCLRENEQDIDYPTEVELLEQIDRLLEIMNRGGELLRKDIPRICNVCGYGVYQLLVEEKPTPVGHVILGFSLWVRFNGGFLLATNAEMPKYF